MTVSIREDQAESMQLRFCRGRELQAEQGHHIEWISGQEAKVPSATGFSKYRVSIAEDDESCSCSDFRINKSRGHRILCKHIIALQIAAASKVKYYIEKRHDSLLQVEIFIVMRVEDNRETVMDWSKSCVEADFMRVEIETAEWAAS